MAAGYSAVTWTKFKRAYDLWLIVGIIVFLGAYIGATIATSPAGERWAEVQLLIRATGALAFVMLTLILAIGPLARLTDRAKPLLYNRRHLGVATFIVALAHAGLVLMWYHGFSELNVFVSLFASNPRYDSIQGFPFESLGFVALLVLFIMAATSHDFWNANLGPRVWKALHMGVYIAYALLVMHVMLGVVQYEKTIAHAALTLGGAGFVAALHLIVGLRERGKDGAGAQADGEGWLSAGPGSAIPDGRAVIVVTPGGERIAVFRRGQDIHAISNVCRHQAGPLGEGCLKDGLVTCPWHGFQYRLEDGVAPAPFTEKLPTFRVKAVDGEIFVDPTPLAPGTPTDPARVTEAA